ncbi:MAG: putative Ig domain-containing protein [Bryobacteraceae bacterium]
MRQSVRTVLELLTLLTVVASYCGAAEQSQYLAVECPWGECAGQISLINMGDTPVEVRIEQIGRLADFRSETYWVESLEAFEERTISLGKLDGGTVYLRIGSLSAVRAHTIFVHPETGQRLYYGAQTAHRGHRRLRTPTTDDGIPTAINIGGEWRDIVLHEENSDKQSHRLAPMQRIQLRSILPQPRRNVQIELDEGLLLFQGIALSPALAYAGPLAQPRQVSTPITLLGGLVELVDNDMAESGTFLPGALDTRSPLILIHGIHGKSTDSDGWSEFISFFRKNDLWKQYHLYRFRYESDVIPVNDIGSGLRTALDVSSMPPKRIVILAHSMGGLVARAFMELQRNGSRGGERVKRLITLATPHHGSPAANADSRQQMARNADQRDSNYVQAWRSLSWASTIAVAYSVWQFTGWWTEQSSEIAVGWNDPNRSDLLWDNYDQSMPQGSEYSTPTYLQQLNASPVENAKIIAYYGYLDPAESSYNALVRDVYSMGPSLLLTKARNGDDHDKLLAVSILLNWGLFKVPGDTKPFAINDGMVPVQSARFDGATVAKRVGCSGNDHKYMLNGLGPACDDAEKLFDHVADDLRVLALPTITNYEGYVDSITCANGIVGWAADKNRLNQAMTVELWEGTTLLTTFVANQHRDDVASYLKDNGNHGFIIPIPQSLKDGRAHSLQVRFAGTTVQMFGSPVTANCSAPSGPPNYEGYVDSITCTNGIVGWAADKNRLNQPLTVELWEGTTLLTTFTANQHRDDVANYLKDNGNHGFIIPIPQSLKDGKAHSLQVRFAGTTVQMFGSPVQLTCVVVVAQPQYEGYLDQSNCDLLKGWAADRSRPNQSINIEIWDGTTLVTTVQANQNRPDVGAYLKDNGNHGFLIQTPSGLKDGRAHNIQVRFAGTTAQLVNSPAPISCGAPTLPPLYEGYVDQADCNIIKGWAADKNRLNQSLNIEIWEGSSLVTTVPANQNRSDVGTYLSDNGNHGFSISTPASLKTAGTHNIQLRYAGSTAQLFGSPTSLNCGTSAGLTIGGVSPSPVTGSDSPQLFTITGTGFTSNSTVTLGNQYGSIYSNTPISSQDATQIVVNPTFGTTAATWWVQVANGGQLSNQYSFQVQAPQSNPPTAHFLMVGQGQTANDGGSLNLSVVGTATAPISLTNTSTQGGSPITTYTWKSNGTTICQNSFSCNYNVGAGSYTVSLTITDTAGQSSSASAQLQVASITSSFSVAPASWEPVFTAGDANGTLGFRITSSTNSGLSGSLTVTTSQGGEWLTVNGQTTYNWTTDSTVFATANPANLSPGIYNATIRFVSSSATNPEVNVPVRMTIYAPLRILSGTLPDAVAGQAYNFQLQGSGGTNLGYTWNIDSGLLPPGLALNTSTGLISGTATNPPSGSTSVTLGISLRDSLPHLAQKLIPMNWKVAFAISDIFPLPSDPFVGIIFQNLAMQAVGGTTPYTWSATQVPPGLNLSSGGVLSGTPTQPGTFPMVVTARDATGQTTNRTFTITVGLVQLVITDQNGARPASLPNGQTGIAYTGMLKAQGGSMAGYTWAITQGTLPSGLTAAPTTGCTACAFVISGTPAQAGTFPLTVRVTDSLNGSASQSVALTINSSTPPQITTTTMTRATIGQQYSFNFAATGGTPPYAWSIVGAPPDPNMSLSSGGTITGVSSVPNDCPAGPNVWVGPSYPTTYFTAKVTDAASQSATKQFCLVGYYPTPQVTGTTPSSVVIDGTSKTLIINGANFRSNAVVGLGTSAFSGIDTAYTSPNASSITLRPSGPGGAFSVSPSNATYQAGAWSIRVRQPYSDISNSNVAVNVYNPAPTVATVSPIKYNSSPAQPCQVGWPCQLSVTGSGFVGQSSFVVGGAASPLDPVSYPPGFVPWNSVTTSTFVPQSAGTYTLTVTNPSQPPGSPSGSGTFTVNP